jgi:hypothetical protein
MRKVKEVLRLKLDVRLSHEQIAAALHLSKVSGDFSSHSFLMPAGAACVHLNHRWTPHDTDSRCPEA